MTTQVEVTQADEDCASAYVRKPVGFLDGENPATVRFTHSQLSQVLSCHRLAAEQAKDAEIAELREVLARIAYEDPNESWQVAHDALKFSARPLDTILAKGEGK